MEKQQGEPGVRIYHHPAMAVASRPLDAHVPVRDEGRVLRLQLRLHAMRIFLDDTRLAANLDDACRRRLFAVHDVLRCLAEPGPETTALRTRILALRRTGVCWIDSSPWSDLLATHLTIMNSTSCRSLELSGVVFRWLCQFLFHALMEEPTHADAAAGVSYFSLSLHLPFVLRIEKGATDTSVVNCDHLPGGCFVPRRAILAGELLILPPLGLSAASETTAAAVAPAPILPIRPPPSLSLSASVAAELATDAIKARLSCSPTQ